MTVSIGICAYNEQENIGILLKNLLHEQGMPFDLEIIAVCSGCTDKTPHIVKEFALKDSRVKLIIEQERRGKASAINKIFRVYRGNYLFSFPPMPSLKREAWQKSSDISEIRGWAWWVESPCLLIRRRGSKAWRPWPISCGESTT